MADDICWASYTKDIELVEKLLSQGADIDSSDRDGRTPLINAVCGKDVQFNLVLLLVDAGANLDAQDLTGYTALHACAQFRLVEIAKLLVDKGAKVDLKDKWGNTPLWRALGKGQECQQLIDLLISHHADPYSKNNYDVSVMDHTLKLKSHPNHEYFKKLNESGS